MKDETKKDHRILEGYFKAPMVAHLPDLLPVESEKAHFQMILPTEQKYKNYKPMVIHYKATGDHGFKRTRKWMALPLLREKGVASIILENPVCNFKNIGVISKSLSPVQLCALSCSI